MASPPVRELLLSSELSPRAELPYMAASVIGLVNHHLLLTLFAVFGIWPMVAFNILSIALFVVVLVLVRRGQVGVALFLALGEVIVHQVLAVYFTGWAPGFQYYLPVVGTLPLLLPDVSTRRRIAFAAIPVLIYIGLLFGHDPSPPNPFPDTVANTLGHINLFVAFSAPWIFVYYLRRGSELAEDRLARSALRNETLLHGILPPTVVGRLREGEVVADSFDDVSILFCDIVGFTSLARRKSPEELVQMLDEIFASFDDLVEVHGLEKIKTIGDAYMVAAGVPEPIDDHAHALADFALAVREATLAYSDKIEEPLSLRLGMHRGRAVAGVIGKTKFAYDIWGEAVNTAARMESHGEPGRIHISAQMAEALRDRFEVSARGTIEIKGMGAMETFWLEGART